MSIKLCLKLGSCRSSHWSHLKVFPEVNRTFVLDWFDSVTWAVEFGVESCRNWKNEMSNYLDVS